MNNTINELKNKIIELENNLRKEEHLMKKKKGILKEGEWYLLNIKDEDNIEDNVIFYSSPQGVVCMNAYLEWYSVYIYDLLEQAPYYQKWKGKKISKKEAINYL
jgi:hypothetical protein